jgi:methionyl-tRNA formyltransferase
VAARPEQIDRPVRIALFAGRSVGLELTRLVTSTDRVACLITDSADPTAVEIEAAAGDAVDATLTNEDLRGADAPARLEATGAELAILAWWPYVVPEDLLAVFPRGVLNLHPSLLPHGRGRHPNFWALRNGEPFGVTIHHAVRAVDAGDIAFQRELEVDWTDTGGSLHQRAQEAIVDLFRESWPQIRAGSLPRVPQAGDALPTHRAGEIDAASRIDLDARYTGRELLDLIRARTYPPHPGAWFEDDGKRYEVRISIVAAEST